VDLHLPTTGLERYKNPAQQARVGTEAWGSQNLYCANCNSSRLERLRANTPARDFVCPKCESAYQLKSQSHRFGRKILDAQYEKMVEAIQKDKLLNLFVLHYSRAAWRVEDLILIPRFALTISAIERKNPLRPTAERAEWVGCYILLFRIPSDARIIVVNGGKPVPASRVRREFRSLQFLAEREPESRGWTLDVWNAIHSLGKREFTIDEAYSLVPGLSALHPDNRHVGPKIRQQLQVLRDMGRLVFLGRGRYRFV
jgi:type II restriction enzyme